MDQIRQEMLVKNADTPLSDQPNCLPACMHEGSPWRVASRLAANGTSGARMQHNPPHLAVSECTTASPNPPSTKTCGRHVGLALGKDRVDNPGSPRP